MAFPDSVVEAAWKRLGERCECRRSTCGHAGRCSAVLSWTVRGLDRLLGGGWEAHHVTADGPDIASNC